jgi:1L-myo-inositol 1-phosphate cytidylyltransferase
VQALIVAAGQGTRLRAHGPSKPLVRLHGKPLIAHVIERLKKGGITSCVVVTGYLHDQLEPALADISAETGMPLTTVFNSDWALANGVSVWSARALLQESFILTMCDHLVDPALVARMVASATPARPSLGVDTALDNPDVDLEDVTRVRVVDGDIVHIGKNIPEYNGFDTGVFCASQTLISALDAARQKTASVSISDGVATLSAPLRAVDVTGLRWIDVDDPVMFDRAKAWLQPT